MPPTEPTKTIRPAAAADQRQRRLGDRDLADDVDVELAAQLVERQRLQRRRGRRSRRC